MGGNGQVTLPPPPPLGFFGRLFPTDRALEAFAQQLDFVRQVLLRVTTAAQGGTPGPLPPVPPIYTPAGVSPDDVLQRYLGAELAAIDALLLQLPFVVAPPGTGGAPGLPPGVQPPPGQTTFTLTEPGVTFPSFPTLSGEIAATPPPTTTTFTLQGLYVAAGVNLAGAMALVMAPTPALTAITANTGPALTVNGLAAPPAPGTLVYVLPLPTVAGSTTTTVYAPPTNITQIGGTTVSAADWTYLFSAINKSAAAPVAVTVGTSPVQIDSPVLANRRAILVSVPKANTAPIYLGWGSSGSTVTSSGATMGIEVQPGGYWQGNLGPAIPVYAISTAAGQTIPVAQWA
jgi:hypothetical protein